MEDWEKITNMCEYCEKPHLGIPMFTDTDEVTNLMVFPNSDEGFTVIHSIAYDDGDVTETEFAVECCPMCGRRN